MLPLVSWWFVTRDVTTALVFTTIGEMYSGNSGTWLSIGPLSIRWLLIFTTIAVNMLIRMWIPRPASRKRIASRSGHALPVLFFGALFPIVLYAIAMVGTENSSTAAFKSVGFLLVLLFYFPLRRALQANPQQLVAFLIGLSITLALLMLSMSIGPMAFREEIISSIIGDQTVGYTMTGIARIMPVHIVLMFFPVFVFIFEMSMEKGRYRKIAYFGAALFFMLPMVVTFLTGTLISMLIMLLLTGGFLTVNNVSRPHGKLIVSATVLTPDLLELKLVSRISGLTSGGGIDPSRDFQLLNFAEDFQNHLWFGQGAGATMDRATGGPQDRVEMEGLMIFHRYGLLGCVVFLAGFVAFAVQPIGLLRKRKSFDSAMAMALAFWATVCTIVMAGMMNPFLTTPFPALFVGLYLVWDERVLSRSSG